MAHGWIRLPSSAEDDSLDRLYHPLERLSGGTMISESGRFTHQKTGSSQPQIRPRTSDDLAECVEILRLVHVRDSYPINWPADVNSWLEELEAAWVAEIDGAVVGHVAARVTEGGVRVVTVERLFVAPSATGLGLGAQLLAIASTHGDASMAVLAVADNGRHAQRLYEQNGWLLRSRTPIEWGGTVASSLMQYELPRGEHPAGGAG